MRSTGRARGRWGPVPIRLAIASGLVCNGAPKLFSRTGQENIVYLLEQTGGPLPEVTSWGLGLFELGGGLAIVAGIRVRLISAAVLVTVMVNLLGALRRGSFPEPLPGGRPLPDLETSAFYGRCALSLVLTGAGAAPGPPWRRTRRPT